jgi:hypothetical protein
MGKNKKLRKGIESLERRIGEHEDKIARERGRFNPDAGLISHWANEIKGWQQQIERKRNHLPGRT